ncbi:MAG TPA: thiopurine S-methyltransferase [Pyrinomonadaceae bacterium]|nr:thiopurine S-methyltransferase [Pyrinomonadaceae bacterium]
MLDTTYWHEKWHRNDIAFHEPKANPLLVKYFKELSLSARSRVFLPLCGKTLDISWLLAKGMKVVGAELSKLAIEQLFRELKLQPEITRFGETEHFRAENIDIFVGDIFALNGKTIGQVDAVYDRAALVALSEKTRKIYTKHLLKITGKAPQLLICYDYDQSLMDGPPFSISEEEIEQHYKKTYQLKMLGVSAVSGGLKGIYEAVEKVWLLKK